MLGRGGALLEVDTRVDILLLRVCYQVGLLPEGSHPLSFALGRQGQPQVSQADRPAERRRHTQQEHHSRSNKRCMMMYAHSLLQSHFVVCTPVHVGDTAWVGWVWVGVLVLRASLVT